MRIVISLCLCLALASCGAAYRSPAVSAAGAGAAVRVVALTGESVLIANRSPYRPRTLPAVFGTTAGSGGALRGAGALPEPVFDAPPRPARSALSVPPAAESGPYTIGVGDVVLLATPRGGGTVSELSGLLAAQNARQGYTVQDDGAINIPDVGRVAIAGLTIDAAESALFQRLVESGIEPTFSLEIAEFNSRKVSVGGAVGRPAVVPVALTALTLDEALARAGGLAAADAEFATIRIYRDGTLYQLPVDRYLSDPALRNTRLQAGDSVFVDTTFDLSEAETYFQQQIALAQLQQQARSAALSQLSTEIALRRAALDEARGNFRAQADLGAVDRDYVYLAGEVGRQSRWPLPYAQQATLADALFDAGQGVPTRTGDVSQIYVLRASDDPRDFGAVTAWHLDATNAANFTLATRMQLRPDDVIFVAEQPVTRWSRVIQQITPSLITTTAAQIGN